MTTTLLKKEVGSRGWGGGMKRYGWVFGGGRSEAPLTLTLEEDLRWGFGGEVKGLFGMGARGRGEVGGGASIGGRLSAVRRGEKLKVVVFDLVF